MRTRQLKAAMVSVVAALALLVPGSSAMAVAATSPALGIRLLTMAVVPGQTSSSSTYLSINDDSVVQVKDLHVTIDTSALPSGLTVDTSGSWGWSCLTSGSTVACTALSAPFVDWQAGVTMGGIESGLQVDVTADATASVKAGSLTATVSGAGLIGATTSAAYSVAEPVTLVGLPNRSVTGPPGTHDAEQWAVTNAGSTTVHGVVLSLEGGSLRFDQHNSNCVYNEINDADCTFDNDLAPGQTYRIAAPMGFSIPATHVAPYRDDVFGGWHPPADLGYAVPATVGSPGQDPPLSLVVQSSGAPAPALTQAGRPQTDQNNLESTNIGITVTGTNPATLVPVGTTSRVAEVGLSATLPLGVQNLGPAVTSMNRSAPITFATVTVPASTTATSVPPLCAPIVSGQPVWHESGQPGYLKYFCPVFTNLGVGRVYPLLFTVKALLFQYAYVGSIGIGDGTGVVGSTKSITIEAEKAAPQPDPFIRPHLGPKRTAAGRPASLTSSRTSPARVG